MIRWVPAKDAATILSTIQFRAVREGPSLYSQAQRQAWVAKPHLPEKLAARLGEAEAAIYRRDGEDVGVMTLAGDGYIDMAFILPEHQGTGVFRALFEAVEARARALGQVRLYTHASLMAQPPFQALGFQVIHQETVERAGQSLPRALMEKYL